MVVIAITMYSASVIIIVIIIIIVMITHWDRFGSTSLIGDSQNPPLQMGGFNLGLGSGALPFLLLGGCFCTETSLGHPAKGQRLKHIKLGFHPHTKPACPRGGSHLFGIYFFQ